MQFIQQNQRHFNKHQWSKSQTYSQLFLAILFIFLQSSASAQTPSPTESTPNTYRFQAETVWDKLTVVVVDFNGHYYLECVSENPIGGWLLLDNQTDATIVNSDDNTGNSFKVSVSKPFVDEKLTVFVQNNDAQVAMVIDLAPEKDKVYKVMVYVPFQENSNRPYNTLVKSLYDQSGQAYAKGDTKSALILLKKAQDIDPTEPQVLAFIAKIQPKPSDNSTEKFIADTLAKAQKAEVDKNSHDAKKWYLEVLNVDPKNQTAINGINRLQAQLLEQEAIIIEKNIKEGDYEKAKIILAKIKLAFPSELRIQAWQDQINQLANASSPSERKAKADEAYNLGLDSYRKDDFVSAKKFWEEALKIDSQYIQAQQNLDRLNQEHPGLQ